MRGNIKIPMLGIEEEGTEGGRVMWLQGRCGLTQMQVAQRSWAVLKGCSSMTVFEE